MVMGAEPQIQVIGTRHGEKLYESLLSRRDGAGGRLRGLLPGAAGRALLDYGLYVEEGEHAVETEHDYTSHNTQRLSVEEVAELCPSCRRCVRPWRRCRGDADRAHRT